MEYYSVEKKTTESLNLHANRWNKKTILSEVTKTQKDEHGTFSLTNDTNFKAKDNKSIVHDTREAKYQGEP